MVREVADYVLGSGGKRLRPALVLLVTGRMVDSLVVGWASYLFILALYLFVIRMFSRITSGTVLPSISHGARAKRN